MWELIFGSKIFFYVFLFFVCFCFCLVVLLRQGFSIVPWMSWKSFRRPCWLQTHRSAYLCLPSAVILGMYHHLLLGSMVFYWILILLILEHMCFSISCVSLSIFLQRLEFNCIIMVVFHNLDRFIIFYCYWCFCKCP